MVDFSKRLKNKSTERKTHPIDIYNSLDRRSIAGPLRPSQESILADWHENRRDSKDLIVKLHTGEGKTLIGLLILQSKLNETGEPALYLCPNIYLANQVKQEAKKFGIPYCEIESDNEIPEEFQTGKSILICHVQKLFNGRTKFGLFNKSITTGSLVLDDSHACIDSIKSALTIRLSKEHPIYRKFIKIFEQDLKDQGEGSFLEIESGSYGTMLPIPYWAWADRKDEITSQLLEHREDKEITFVWELIKNSIDNCQAFICGSYLEISPILMPVSAFGTFSKAKQRVLMSATTQDDSFAIKGLGFEVSAINNPLSNKSLKWSGEKMILLPTLIDASLDRESIVNWLGKPNNLSYGIVFLTPDFSKRHQYEKLGTIFADTKTIFDCVQDLKNGKHENPYAFSNRYDGIDLPDDACRILVIDSKPYFDSLLDRYEEDCRTNSDIINIKIAQKVEQGLGRSVRGEKDFSVILIVGGDITKFVKSKTSNRYFSPQTRKQIDIGLQIAEFAKEDLKAESNPYKVLLNLMKQSLERNDDWKEYYIESMNEIISTEEQPNLYETLKMEFDAELNFASGRYDKACEIMQRLSDTFNSDPSEKGWYTQQLARYRYKISKSDSNSTQISAFTLNTQLLKPKTGISYKKINYIDQNRIERIKTWISQHKSLEELQLATNGLVDNLIFGVASEKFELAFKELGEALGFTSQRPDKEIKKGPDILWCINNNEYILIECKNEVEDTRVEISKHEAGQMNSHCGWFEENYGNANCKRILVIPTKKLSYHANFTHSVQIMRKGTLKRLRENFKSFTMELYKYDLRSISDTKIQDLIDQHRLDERSLKETYTEEYTKSNN